MECYHNITNSENLKIFRKSEKFLKIEDYGKYLKTLNDIDINIMILEKDKLKKERLIENNFSQYIKSLEKNAKWRCFYKQSSSPILPIDLLETAFLFSICPHFWNSNPDRRLH